MRHLLTILAVLLLCSAPLHAQTLKSLMYNSTNGQVVAATNVVWTNSFSFSTNTVAAQVRTNLSLGWSALTNTNAATSLLGFTTNGQVVANTGTNVLTFTNQAIIQADPEGDLKFSVLAGGFAFYSDVIGANILNLPTDDTVELNGGVWNDPSVRASLGFSTNLNTLWTATNASNARSAVGVGATNAVSFASVSANYAVVGGSVDNPNTAFVVDDGYNEETHYALGSIQWYSQYDLMGEINLVNQYFASPSLNSAWTFHNPIAFNNTTNAAITRTNLGLGASNIVTFAGLTNNGDITINQTATNNGLLYIRRTNSEPFLGLANLLASNNTTVSNETLFRVGVAEATNRSAQFGFRSTNTNGNGVAVFSVFGFDALMMIGADASTNAVIYSGGGTNNEVMTLIRDGATEFARPLRFSTNASTRPSTNAPANTTNVAAWVEMRIGTNSYRVPLYQ